MKQGLQSNFQTEKEDEGLLGKAKTTWFKSGSFKTVKASQNRASTNYSYTRTRDYKRKK
jgi:hypothetical protein